MYNQALSSETTLFAEHLPFFADLLKSEGDLGTEAILACSNGELSKWTGKEYEVAAHRLSVLLRNRTSGQPTQVNHRVLAISALMLSLAERVKAMSLPISVLQLYPREIGKIRRYISQDPAGAYQSDDDDAFIKDARTVCGLSLPCGAQSAEIDDRVRFRSLVKHAVLTRELAPLVQLARPAVERHWFGIHTDSRDLQDFNESGWRDCYVRLAELLRWRPSIAGVVGTSWFFDPQLETVSPRLAYLRRIPMDNGAVAIRNGPGPIHTQRATATSESRRKLYEQGKYLPVCYTIAWPRASLLEWARHAGQSTG